MSIDDCPDCRKLQSECEALERELAIARGDWRTALNVRDPRAPKPVLVPAAVPPRKDPSDRERYCAICDRVHGYHT